MGTNNWQIMLFAERDSNDYWLFIQSDNANSVANWYDYMGSAPASEVVFFRGELSKAMQIQSLCLHDLKYLLLPTWTFLLQFPMGIKRVGVPELILRWILHFYTSLHIFNRQLLASALNWLCRLLGNILGEKFLPFNVVEANAISRLDPLHPIWCLAGFLDGLDFQQFVSKHDLYMMFNCTPVNEWIRRKFSVCVIVAAFSPQLSDVTFLDPAVAKKRSKILSIMHAVAIKLFMHQVLVLHVEISK